jgi:dTDP-4-dehydrorhamnose 3,5-epimerase
VVEDDRGSFARTRSARDFEAAGLNPMVAECSVSRNRLRGTLRGLHLQAAPDREAKLVTCSRGRLFDVAVDLRPGSPTYAAWTAIELTSENLLALYVPEGMAHGFVTLEPDTEVRYQISVPYRPEAALGIRWDDPDIGIDWPEVGSMTMSDRDRHLPRLADLGGTLVLPK